MYIYGLLLKAITSHHETFSSLTSVIPPPRIQRFMLQLQNYDFMVNYITWPLSDIHSRETSRHVAELAGTDVTNPNRNSPCKSNC